MPLTDHALLCYDGSEDAAAAIAMASELLQSRDATVLTVCEPPAIWEPYDIGAVLSTGVSRMVSEDLNLEQIAAELARSTLDRGLQLAREAGFDATGEVRNGKAWRTICEAAEEFDAAPIVLGARGLSRVRSVLLGSVTAAVLAHVSRAVLVSPPALDSATASTDREG